MVEDDVVIVAMTVEKLFIALGVAAIAVAASLVGCRSAEEALPYVCRQCNVLLISLDTLRADHVGAYGYQRPTTPNIDALARRGVVFENAVAQSSWTRPAHLSMFTGLYPAEHGVLALRDSWRLAKSIPTLAAILRDHGYSTAAFTGGVNMAADYGFDQGFDSYRNNGKYFRDNFEETQHWLEQHREERFFLFWHGYDAHTPYLNDPIDRLALKLEERRPRKSLRKACRTPERRRPINAYAAEYDGAIHRGDRYVGKLLARMKDLGMLENTLIVFVSDHGEELLEHGSCFHLSTLYREVLHVPFIIAAPGIAARRVAELVPASVSVGPTILDLVGIGGAPLPGPSLAAAIGGHPVKATAVVSETYRDASRPPGRGHVRSVTAEHGKLIHWVTQGRREYFDLRRDPAEQEPVTDGGERAALSRQLERWAAEHTRQTPIQGEAGAVVEGDEAAGEASDPQGQLEQQLRSLGYLQQ